MLDITINLETGVAALARTTAIKAGGTIPVRITFSTSPGENPGIELALSPGSGTPSVLAYLNAWSAQNKRVFLGALNTNDSRLIAHLASLTTGTATMNVELVVTVGSDAQPFANFPVTVQRPVITAPTSSEGGPVYLTEAMRASQAEAEAGTDNTKWMTPLRTAEAIATLAGVAPVGTPDLIYIIAGPFPEDAPPFALAGAINGNPSYTATIGGDPYVLSWDSAGEGSWLISAGGGAALYFRKAGADLFVGEWAAEDFGTGLTLPSLFPLSEPKRVELWETDDGQRFVMKLDNNGAWTRILVPIVLAMILPFSLFGQTIKEVTTTNGTLQGTSLRLNTATNFNFGGVAGSLQVEAQGGNHAIAARASDETDGAAFYGWSESGAPAMKLVQSNNFNSPALTVWRTPNGNDALSSAVLIAGSPTNGTNIALKVQRGSTNVFTVNFNGLPSLPSAATVTTAIDWTASSTFTHSLTGNKTFTFTNSTDGQTIIVRVVNPASHTVTWPSVKWRVGTPPTQTASGTDIYTFINIGGTIYGAQNADLR